jgi:glycosyltransferase involved in cell wall biosynthesis
MKVLYIVPDITDSGGIARIIALKTNYLVTHFKYDVCILSVNNCQTKSFYDFDQAIRWYNICKINNPFLFLKIYIHFLKKTISLEKPDVIIVCDAVLWVFIPWFLKTKIPLIFETHFSVKYQKENNDSFYNKIRTKIVLFFKQNTINKFYGSVFETIAGSLEWNLKQSKVIPNPLSFNVNNTAILVNKRVMAVCMNPYVKGLDRLLLIWAKVIENHSDWVLDIYGQWDTDLKYSKMVNDLNISNNVNFCMPTATIQDKYNQSSLFLMTSRSEAFGMVLIEAMACGLPCVAYDCPIGPRAIIEENVNGFLIEDGNAKSFVQKVKLLIEDENLRIQMGRCAQESVKKYEINSIMKQWESLFESLVKQ